MISTTDFQIEQYDVLGTKISAINMSRAVQVIDDLVQTDRKGYVCVCPVSTIMACYHDSTMRDNVNSATLATPDGMPVVWVGRRKGYKNIERVYGPDLMLKTLELSAEKGYRNYFYGSTEDVLNKLQNNLKNKFTRLNICGEHAPPFRKLSSEENDLIVEKINAAEPDIVWVGLGSPKQDYWMVDKINRLNAKVLIGVGAAFDFLSGVKPQAPRWMQKMGFEWLFRLISEPKRLWKRYLIGNSKFIYLLIKEALFKKKRIMINYGRKLLIKLLYITIDIASMGGAIFLAIFIRGNTVAFDITFQNVFLSPINPFRFIFYFWMLVSLILNNTYDLYETKRERNETIEIWEVIKSVFFSSLITIVAIYIFRVEDFPRSVLILVFGFGCTFFSLWRVLKRFLVEYLVSQGYNNFNVLIIGAGKVAGALTDEIDKRPALGLNIVGYLDDFKENDPDGKGPKIIGKIKDFRRVSRREFVNEVFITVHDDSQLFLNILEQAKELGVAVRVVPQGFELMTGKFTNFNIGIIPILEYSAIKSLRKQVGKRLFDFLTVLITIILFLPVFFIIMIIIKTDSPGPIFYKSRRYGRNGRIFNMYKFRSMVPDADKQLSQFKERNEVDGPIFKIKDDPRITRFGKFLRKYSIDEFPQFFNVLKGNMSLVGPRPLPIEQVEREDLRQLERLEVRPGITGLWQIRGRSDISFARLVKWDVWYINNWSFWLDITILFLTIPVVLKGKGAY